VKSRSDCCGVGRTYYWYKKARRTAGCFCARPLVYVCMCLPVCVCIAACLSVCLCLSAVQSSLCMSPASRWSPR